MTLKLAIPSKGRLQEDTINWFAQHGITIVRGDDAREYAAYISGIENVELVLMSAGEIPGALNDNRIQLGVTGQDLIAEKLPLWKESLNQVAAMGFGFADLVLAVPDCWADVQDLEDLDAVSTDFRRVYGFRLRIATKYHRLVSDYLIENDVTNFQLIDSQGATEGVVANEYAEMIADITSTGDTIRANHLRVLGEPILKSQATLFGVKDHDLTEDQKCAMEALRGRLANA